MVLFSHPNLCVVSQGPCMLSIDFSHSLVILAMVLVPQQTLSEALKANK